MIATFTLAILAASGFLTVGVATLVGTKLDAGGGAYGLLLGIAGVAEVLGASCWCGSACPISRARPYWHGCCLVCVGSRSDWSRRWQRLRLCCTARRVRLGHHRHPGHRAGAATHPGPPPRQGAGSVGGGHRRRLASHRRVAGFILQRAGVEWGFAISGTLLIGIGLTAAAVLHRVSPNPRS